MARIISRGSRNIHLKSLSSWKSSKFFCSCSSFFIIFCIAALRPNLRSSQQKSTRNDVANSDPFFTSAIDSESPSWQQHTFMEHGHTGLVQFSAYQMTPTKFAIIGLQRRQLDTHGGIRYWKDPEGSRVVSNVVAGSGGDTRCQWIDSMGKTSDGSLHFLFTDEHHNAPVETVVIHCTLTNDTSPCSGHLVATIDGADYTIFALNATQASQVSTSPKSQLAFCSPTMHSDLRVDSVFDWVDFHRVNIGVSRFILYDAGVLLPRHTPDRWQSYVDSGTIEIVDFRGQERYETWFHSQTLAMHDCLYRTRDLSHWVVMVDFDEYLQVMPPLSMASLLARYGQKSWLSFGGRWWDIHLCNDDMAMPAGLGRMVFRSEGFFCARPGKQASCHESTRGWPGRTCSGLFGELCDIHHGRRKYLLQPKKVDLLLVHEVLLPAGNGVVLNARTQFRLNHFRWLTACRFERDMCNKTVGGTDGVEGWVRDDSLSKMAKIAQGCPLGNAAECTYHWS